MSNEAPTDALRLVPVEPTEAMLDAMFSAYCASDGSYRDVYRAMLAAAPASPLPGGGWHTNFDDAPKDGRWIVTIDKWRNAETMRWSNEVSRLFPEQGERGWVAKGGYSPTTRPELSVAWAELPAAPTGEPK